MPKIATRNRNKTEKLKRKSKSQTRNESPNKKNIPGENKIKPEKIYKKKIVFDMIRREMPLNIFKALIKAKIREFIKTRQ
jgi:hypothetical protein